MGNEYEIKVLDVDVAFMCQLLVILGFQMVHNTVRYYRVVYHMASSDIHGFVKIRDENGRVFMTSKRYDKNLDYPEEFEFEIVGTIDDAMKFMASIGMVMKAYHVTRRMKWIHDKMPDLHEIVFDTIPGIPTYMEIDCGKEELLNNLIEVLGINKDKIRKGGYDRTYNEYYGIELDDINNRTPNLTFKGIIDEISHKVTKNQELLVKMAEIQSDF